VSLDAEWSKDHVLAIGAYTLLYLGYYYWRKWRLDGAIRGSVEDLEGKDGESVVAILRFLCGSPRLCRLRIEGLIPVSKY
jgi:hypothetical protein